MPVNNHRPSLLLAKQLDLVIAKELNLAKMHLAKGDKKRALLALRRKKFQEGLLEKTLLQMSNLDELVGVVGRPSCYDVCN